MTHQEVLGVFENKPASYGAAAIGHWPENSLVFTVPDDNVGALG